MAEVADLLLPEDEFEEEEEEEEEEEDIGTLVKVPFWCQDLDHEEIDPSDSNPFSSRQCELGPSDRSLHDQIIIDGDVMEEGEACVDIVGSNGSDSDSVTDLNYFNSQDHQVNLVIDLFERCNEQTHVVDNNDFVLNPFADDPFFRVTRENNETGSNFLDRGLGLGLGFDTGNGDDDEENGGFMISECSDEFFVGRRSESGESSAIRAVEPFGDRPRIFGNEFDSDDEEEGVVGIDLRSREDDGLDRATDDLGLPLCWDCLRFDDQREYYEEFEWEEVDDRVDEREVMIIDADEERSVSSEIQSEAMRILEWEVLLAVNNLERNTELEHDDFIYPAEYEMLVGQFMGNEASLRGSPPAAKTVVENLPSAVLTEDYVQNKIPLCAVCKDEFSMEEQTKMLPCSHYYHGDCILPWLKIRNTCPVCRFELPTDDPDYERKRIQQTGHGLSDDSQVRYNFEIFPEP